MTKTFVAINDPVHSLIRNVTRRTPLVVRSSITGPASPEYQVSAREVPEAYYSLAVFHSIGGLSLASLQKTRWRVNLNEKAALLDRVNYFDAVRLDRRCCRDLRLKLRKEGPGMLAAEWLAFGTGTLRACNDDPLEQTHRYLWSQHGRLRPRQQIVYAKIRALHLNSLPLLHQPRKESFESTNVIYGDALGEVEQLWDRRADTAFLEQVAQSLRPMRQRAEIAAFSSPPLNLQEVMRLHLRAQALWRIPPANARILLRRVEYLLEHIAVDDTPCAFFRRHESELEVAPDRPAPGSGGWTTDSSGYDGWLSRDQDDSAGRE